MIKIKKGHQILFKEEAASEIEKLLREVDIETIDDQTEDWTQNNERWTGFKCRYEDEFESKINLLDSIITKKRNRLKVTWISILKKQ
jgi:hypothetical protein